VTLSEAQIAQAVALTEAYRRVEGTAADKIAAIVAAYYLQKVDPMSLASVNRWLDIVVPALIRTSDDSARRAAAYFLGIRGIEAPGSPLYSPVIATGTVDQGVRESLLAMGPYNYANKMKANGGKRLSSKEQLIIANNLAAATLRHAQAGGRQTIFENSAKDRTALAYVRVTKAEPCFFCVMLQGRFEWRPFSEDSFEASNSRFTGAGDAKVHDNCHCSLKPIYSRDDKYAKDALEAAELWGLWGIGKGKEAINNFRQGYNHWRETGSKDWKPDA